MDERPSRLRRGTPVQARSADSKRQHEERLSRATSGPTYVIVRRKGKEALDGDQEDCGDASHDQVAVVACSLPKHYIVDNG